MAVSLNWEPFLRVSLQEAPDCFGSIIGPVIFGNSHMRLHAPSSDVSWAQKAMTGNYL